MSLLFRILARLPLTWMQALGVALGWCVWVCSPSYRARFNTQIMRAKVDPKHARAAIAHAGRMVAEMPWAWSRPMGQSVLHRLAWSGSEHLHAAFQAGRGVILVSPHLGSWEVGAQALSEHYGSQYGDWVVLFRPHRKPWLRSLVAEARQRRYLRAVPTNLSGIRAIVRALRAGHATAILPDQVPPLGQGVWAPFFGQPAYTVTLLPWLVQQTGACVLSVWCERLPAGRFKMHILPWRPALSPDVDIQAAVTDMNLAIEELVRAHPGQYLWGYDRHKPPRKGD